MYKTLLACLALASVASCEQWNEAEVEERQASCPMASVLNVNATFQQILISLHNLNRSAEPASGMFAVQWDNTLAARAQAWANVVVNISLQHNYTSFCNGTGFGQNIWAGGATFNYTSAVGSWYSEKQYYSITSNTCSAVCGHYTQVVWANTRYVGCGWAQNPSGYQVLVCNYYPPGNYNGQTPYTVGTPGTTCASTLSPPAPGMGWTVNPNGLCDFCQGGSPNCNCYPCTNGTVNPNTCTCNCNAGFTGTTCNLNCADQSPYCNQWLSLCNNTMYQPFMQSNCPCYCTKVGSAPGFTCCS